MGKKINRHAPLIELHKVTRTFDGDSGSRANGLVDISLRINAGEFVCITGPSGSGKSTLLNIIGCLDRLTTGSYWFGGQDISGFTGDGLARLRRRAFGFVFQESNLLESANAQDNVELPMAYTMLDRRHRRDRARQLLTILGLGDRMAHLPSELSGGEQQRVSIARALANGAPVVIADEPTGALNTEQGNEVMVLLKELAERGHAIVVASHDPATVAQATRIIELRDGRLVRDSNVQEDTNRSTPLARIQQDTAVVPVQAVAAPFVDARRRTQRHGSATNV